MTVMLWYLYILIPTALAAADYRLIEKSTNSGILQVRAPLTTTWGTVCAYGYDVEDATVICRSLGMNHTDARPIEVDYKEAYSPVLLNRLECKGDENILTECPNVTLGVVKCPGNRVVRVYCDRAYEHKFRLMGSYGLSAGRVELFRQGSWGTVQIQFPKDEEAQVLCRSLGFPYKMARFLHRWHGGTGKVWLQAVSCKGDESGWFKCHHAFYEDPNQLHYTDVALSCEDLQLVNKIDSNTGALEGYFSDKWRPVIASFGFSNLAASVACRVLGLPRSGAEVEPRSNILVPNERTVLEIGLCYGYELTLTQCVPTKWTPSRLENVVITCKSVDVSKVKFRLHESKVGFVGRLEVFANNEWGTVCNSRVTNQTAAVACRTLGLPSKHALVVPTEYTGEGTGTIWIQGLECKGTEQSLLDCNWNRWENGVCTHMSDLNIYCGTHAYEFKMRLVDGKDDNSGRVEVFGYAGWDRVCNLRGRTVDASVVCRELGKPSAAAKTTSCFEEGTEPFWIKLYSCESSDLNLQECTSLQLMNRDNCESVKVICSDENVDDTKCFSLSSWVYVVICVGILTVLFIVCLTVKSRYKGGCGRRDPHRRDGVYSVRMTNIPNNQSAELVSSPSALNADPPPYSGTPPYSEPPPSYNALYGNKEDETPTAPTDPVINQ